MLFELQKKERKEKEKFLIERHEFLTTLKMKDEWRVVVLNRRSPRTARPAELSTASGMFYICANTVVTSHMWLRSTWNTASTIEEMKSLFHLILINLNLNSHMRIMATTLDAATPRSLCKSLSKQLLHALYRTDAQALAGVAQWIEHWRANQTVAGSIPSQGICLGFRPGPW